MEFFKSLNVWYRRGIAAVIGGAAGFAYYHYVGCASGTCPITSNPYISVAYGMVMGGLIVDNKKKKDQEKDDGTNPTTGQEV
jgi:hypothetical protein